MKLTNKLTENKITHNNKSIHIHRQITHTMYKLPNDTHTNNVKKNTHASDAAKHAPLMEPGENVSTARETMPLQIKLAPYSY